MCLPHAVATTVQSLLICVMNEDLNLEESYDGIDDNIEILLEGALEDPNQAYIYIRIKAMPDEEELLVEQLTDSNWVYTPNTDLVSILSNGTESQLAMMFIELFQMNPVFLDAVRIAIDSMNRYGTRKTDE